MIILSLVASIMRNYVHQITTDVLS